MQGPLNKHNFAQDMVPQHQARPQRGIGGRFGARDDVELAVESAIAVAQSQEARSFELRAALALAQLYRAANRAADA